MQTHHSRALPFLGGLSRGLEWAEELASIVNGPALLLAGGVALIDLLSGGTLLTVAPWLLWLWAVVQALGVDVQLLASARRVAQHSDGTKMGTALAAFWAANVVVLGAVAYQANLVFGYQIMQGKSEAAALAHMGITPEFFIAERALLAVYLVVLSGLTRPAHSAMGEDAPERGASAPAPSSPNVRTIPAPRASQRVASAPAYASRRTDGELVKLGAKWEALAAEFCADKPSVGGRQLLTFMQGRLMPHEWPTRAKCQELAVKHRPAVLQLQAPRSAAPQMA